MTIKQLAELEARCMAAPNEWCLLPDIVGRRPVAATTDSKSGNWAACRDGDKREWFGATLLDALRAMELATGVTL